MANDLNRCEFIGRLGKDPEQRFLPAGETITNIALAVGWKTTDKEGVEWVSIAFFGKLSEITAQYLKKGSQIYVSGRWKTEKWKDKAGNDRYTTKVIGEKMQMLGGTRSTDTPAQDRHNEQKSNGYMPETVDDFEPDVPF